MTSTQIAILVLVGAAVIVLLYLWRAARGKRRAIEDVPPGMRPAYSDEELEQTIRVRYLAWGVLLTGFFAIFLPLYWLNEANRLQEETEGFFVVSVLRGEDLYVENCARCHGQDATGGGAASPYDPEDSWPAPDLTTMAARYENNALIEDVRDYLIDTIARGRPGTPMPTWGAAYGGPLTDQQIEEIADWILANQVDEAEPPQAAADLTGEDLFVANCAKCHGDEGRGLVGPTLVGVFERHSRESILGILRNGVNIRPVTMPPWQNGYMYQGEEGEGTAYTDEALNKIIDHLEALQPEEIPEDAQNYVTPGQGPPAEDDTDAEPAQVHGGAVTAQGA